MNKINNYFNQCIYFFLVPSGYKKIDENICKGGVQYNNISIDCGKGIIWYWIFIFIILSLLISTVYYHKEKLINYY